MVFKQTNSIVYYNTTTNIILIMTVEYYGRVLTLVGLQQSQLFHEGIEILRVLTILTIHFN